MAGFYIVELSQLGDAAVDNVPMPDPVYDDAQTEWVSGTDYTKDEYVYWGEMQYQAGALIDGTAQPDTGLPENIVDPANSLLWVATAPLNTYQWRDGYLGTSTEQDDELVISESGIQANFVAIFAATGTSVDVTYGSFSVNIPIAANAKPTPWWDYFFTLLGESTADVLIPLPNIASAQDLEIKINAAGSVAKAAQVVVGYKHEIGCTLAFPQFSGKDFSQRGFDKWGAFSIEEGAYADVMTCDVEINDWITVESVRNLFKRIRAKIAIFVAEDKFKPGVILGWAEKWDITLEGDAYEYDSAGEIIYDASHKAVLSLKLQEVT